LYNDQSGAQFFVARLICMRFKRLQINLATKNYAPLSLFIKLFKLLSIIKHKGRGFPEERGSAGLRQRIRR
jgi:hypothetical protein